MKPSIVAPALKLPPPFTARPATLDDAEAMCQLFGVLERLIGIEREHDADILRDDWQQPRVDLVNNVRLITTQNDEIVGFAMIFLSGDPISAFYVSWNLLPEHRHQDIEPLLFTWIQQRCRQYSPMTTASMWLSAWEQDTYRLAWLESWKATIEKFVYDMLIELQQAPVVPPLPQGYAIRPLRYPDELETALKVSNTELDPATFDVVKAAQEELYFHKVHPEFDPTLLFVLTYQNELVGTTWAYKVDPRTSHLAGIYSVAILREHRGKGLAQTILLHAFNVLWHYGKPNITLYVDSDNKTHAVRLYEKIGMHRFRTVFRYRMELHDVPSVLVS